MFRRKSKDKELTEKLEEALKLSQQSSDVTFNATIKRQSEATEELWKRFVKRGVIV